MLDWLLLHKLAFFSFVIGDLDDRIGRGSQLPQGDDLNVKNFKVAFLV